MYVHDTVQNMTLYTEVLQKIMLVRDDFCVFRIAMPSRQDAPTPVSSGHGGVVGFGLLTSDFKNADARALTL